MADKSKITQQDTQKREKELQEEREKISILMKADEIKEETFSFDTDGQFVLKNEIEKMQLEEIDDPEKKYELYYKVVNRILKKHLPKGADYKDVRDIIYEEKNTFLTRGRRKDKSGIRGADSRMSYITDITDLINIIIEWVTQSGTPYDLFTKIRDLNRTRGYNDPIEE